LLLYLVSGYLEINIQSANNPTHFVYLFDMQGNCVWSSKTTNKNIRLDISGYSAGIYLLEEQNQATGRAFLKKIVVE